MGTIDLNDDFDAEMDSESTKSWDIHRKVKPRAGWAWLFPVLFWVAIACFAWERAHGLT